MRFTNFHIFIFLQLQFFSIFYLIWFITQIEQIIIYSSTLSRSFMRFNSLNLTDNIKGSNSIGKSQLYNRLFKRQLTRQFTYKEINQLFKKLQSIQAQKSLCTDKPIYSPFVLRNYSPQRVLYHEGLQERLKQQKDQMKLPLMKERIANLQGSTLSQDIFKLSKIKYFPRNSIQKENNSTLRNKVPRISEGESGAILNKTSCSFLNKTNFSFVSKDKQNYSVLNSTRSKVMFGSKNSQKKIKISDIYPLQKLLQKKQKKSFRNKWFISKNQIQNS